MPPLLQTTEGGGSGLDSTDKSEPPVVLSLNEKGNLVPDNYEKEKSPSVSGQRTFISEKGSAATSTSTTNAHQKLSSDSMAQSQSMPKRLDAQYKNAANNIANDPHMRKSGNDSSRGLNGTKRRSRRQVFEKSPPPPEKFKDRGLLNFSYSTVSTKNINCPERGSIKKFVRQTTFVRDMDKYVLTEVVLVYPDGTQEYHSKGVEENSRKIGEGKSGILTSSLLAGDVIKGMVAKTLTGNPKETYKSTTTTPAENNDVLKNSLLQEENQNYEVSDDIIAASNPWFGRFCCGATM